MLEFIDGFDHYNNMTNMLRKWDASSSNTVSEGFSPGRFGGNCFSYSNANTTQTESITLTSVATRIVGFAFQWTSSGAGNGCIFLSFMDSGSTQVDLRWNGTGSTATLSVTRNGTVLGTSTNTMNLNTWYYVELSVTIGSTTGAYTLRVTAAGTTTVWLSATNVNTQATANSTSNQVVIGGTPWNTYFYDDLYVLNTSGSANNSFLGESRVFTSLPTGDDAAYKQWTPSAGTSHYANVNQNPPDDDSTYNSSQTVGQIDLYTFPAISPTGSIFATQTVLTARKDDVGARTIEEECRSAGATYSGANSFPPGSSYAMFRQIREVDPATGVAWTVSGLNAAEFGVVVLA